MLFIIFLFSYAHADVFYPPSYEDSRTVFRALAQQQKGQRVSFQVPSSTDPDLYVDVYTSPSIKSQGLVILFCGIHGGESYFSCGALNWFFQNQLKLYEDRGLSFVLVHAMNPFGFKNFRRVTENNVDLNRNFIFSEAVRPENKNYEIIRPFLIDTKPIEEWTSEHLGFFSKLIYTHITKPAGFLLSATAVGQYSDDKGIFYGGKKTEPQVSFIYELLKGIKTSFDKVLFIDLHTGYGKKDYLHFFGTKQLPSEHIAFTDQVFSFHPIDYGGDKNFYQTSGDTLQFISQLFANKKVAVMTYEMGTLDSQKIIGSMKSLQTLRIENQLWNWGAKTEKDRKWSQDLSRRMFFPEDEKWQKTAEKQVKSDLLQAIENFSK